MAFTLGLYYANFIFEQTSLNLTLSEIYNTNSKNTNKPKMDVSSSKKDFSRTELIKTFKNII